MFTPENAAEMARLAAKARRDNALARVRAGEALMALTTTHPDYLVRRLARVRLQLEKLDEMMMNEKDPGKLDRLASAASRLAEQERVLDERPLPGSFKPVAPRKKHQDAPQSADDPLPSESPSCGVPPPSDEPEPNG